MSAESRPGAGIRRARGSRIAIGFVLSVICIVVLVARIDWRQTVSALVKLDPLFLVMASGLLLLCYATFSVRWWILTGCQASLRISRLFAVLTIGLAVNAALPLRPGDGLRAYVIGHVDGYGTMRAIGSIVLERLLDVTTIVVIGEVLALKAGLPGSISLALTWTALVTAAIVGAMVALIAFSGRLKSLLREVAMRRQSKWLSTVQAHISELVAGLTVAGGPWRLLCAAALSAIGWAFFSGAMVACLAAFDIPSLLLGALLVTVLTNLGGIIPSSPGSIGIYHALGVLALSITGVAPALALAATVASHAIIIAVQLLLGLVSVASMDGMVRNLAQQWRSAGPTD
jgi:hypothetical protein